MHDGTSIETQVYDIKPIDRYGQSTKTAYIRSPFIQATSPKIQAPVNGNNRYTDKTWYEISTKLGAFGVFNSNSEDKTKSIQC